MAAAPTGLGVTVLQGSVAPWSQEREQALLFQLKALQNAMTQPRKCLARAPGGAALSPEGPQAPGALCIGWGESCRRGARPRAAAAAGNGSEF